jgi:hypothetical protein
LTWSPSEFTPYLISVRSKEVADFGFLEEGKAFMPCFRWVPFSFDGELLPGQTMRYGFEVVSDNFHSPRLQVFEVSWNGLWSRDLNQMEKNLQIREVTE